MRVTLLVIVALAAAVLAGCGSSGGDTASSAAAITIPSGVHDFYGEAEAVLDQLPYQSWYTEVRRREDSVSRSARSKPKKSRPCPNPNGKPKPRRMIAKVGPECEKSSDRPVIDPNASEAEIALYRAGYVAPLTAIAEEDNFDKEGVACVEEAVESLPAKKVVTLGNGARKARAAILVSILTPCAGGE